MKSVTALTTSKDNGWHNSKKRVGFTVGDLSCGEGAVLRRILSVRDVRILHGALAGATVRHIQPGLHVRASTSYPDLHVRLHSDHHLQWVSAKSIQTFVPHGVVVSLFL